MQSPGSKFLAKILNDAWAKILGMFLPQDLDKNYQDLSLIKVLGRLRARKRARNPQELTGNNFYACADLQYITTIVT